MIGAFAEGIAQSLLPCSWILLLPAISLGLATRRVVILGTLVAAVVLTAWIVAAGWFAAPLWLAGAALLAGGLRWWRFGTTHASAALVGVGSAWAWQPCVGPELGEELTTAQYDPVATFGGLTMFLLGVLVDGVEFVRPTHRVRDERVGAWAQHPSIAPRGRRPTRRSWRRWNRWIAGIRRRVDR